MRIELDTNTFRLISLQRPSVNLLIATGLELAIPPPTLTDQLQYHSLMWLVCFLFFFKEFLSQALYLHILFLAKPRLQGQLSRKQLWIKKMIWFWFQTGYQSQTCGMDQGQDQDNEEDPPFGKGLNNV